METIEIRFEDLNYIICTAEEQFRRWYEKFSDETDRIEMQKCEEIRRRISTCSAMDFIIAERPF